MAQLGWFLESKMRTPSAVPDRKHQQRGEGMELQAPHFCEGSVIPASTHRTTSPHYFHLQAATARRRARLLSPQHPRSSLSPRRCALARPPLSLPEEGGQPVPPCRWGGGRGEGCPQGRGRGEQEPPPRGAEGVHGRWLFSARIHPERWPRRCSPLSFPPSQPPSPVPTSPPKPQEPLRPRFIRSGASRGAGGRRRRHGPGREQPRRLPAAPLPWPGSRPSLDDVAGRPAGGRLGSRPGGRKAAGGPGRPPGAPGAAGEAAGAGAGSPGHAAAAGGGRSRAAPVRPQQGTPAGGHPHRIEGAAGKGRDGASRCPQSRGAAGGRRGALRDTPLSRGSRRRRVGAESGQSAAAAAAPPVPPVVVAPAGRCERRGPGRVAGASCGHRARPCRDNGGFSSSGGAHLSACARNRNA